VDGDVLDLDRHDIAAPGQLGQRAGVVERRGEDLCGGRDRRVGRGVDGEAADAEGHAGQGQHPAELAAAEDPDGGHAWRGSGAASTAAVCVSRHACSRTRTSGRRVATMAVASRAALTAPALPIAMVPRDAGGHLHDGQQRVEPLEVLRRHRDPEDGQDGVGGQHPGQVRGPTRRGDDRPRRRRRPPTS
jgi:hypothetical protein